MNFYLRFARFEGAGKTRTGQGAARRRFLRANPMFELLYLHGIGEAENGPGE